MRILITGKNGQLGRCLQKSFLETNYEIFSFSSAELDISKNDSVIQHVEAIQPDLIINAAAYTAVDKAEEEPEQAYLVNSKGPEFLAKAAASLDIPIIHVSTDYVFDGRSVVPYSVLDQTSPESVYGASKLAGEKAVQSCASKFIIFRTAWVFSEYGNNFVKTMVRLAKEKDELTIVADQYGSPTYAGDLADAIKQVCDQYFGNNIVEWGLYHYCSDSSTSWHGFARSIFSLAKEIGVVDKIPRARAVSSDLYPTLAKRPEFSVLNTHALSRLSISAPCWLSSLKYVLKALK